ncbi:MAG: polysaccharide biosynthesis protein [Oscillospiraceae bacterium]|nr:polysaccharide biosynthesis protein [Oscillospiraceae bacterium]
MSKTDLNSIQSLDPQQDRSDRGKRIIRIVLLMIADALLMNIVQVFSLVLRYEFQLDVMASSAHFSNILFFMPVYTVIALLVFHLMGLYSSLWEYAGIDEALRIIAASIIVSALQYVLMLLLNRSIPRSFPILNAAFLSIAIALIRFSYRIVRSMVHRRHRKRMVRTMLIGAGDAASVALKDLTDSETSRNKIVCIIDDDPNKQGRRLRGIPIVGGRNAIPEAARRYQVDQIILAIPSATAAQRREITTICQSTGCETKLLPSITQIASGRLDIRQIRKVQIEDLLGRDSVKVNMEEIASYVEGKVILVTGGGGSIGSELCRQISSHKPSELLIFDIYENGAYDIQQELRRKYPDLKLDVLIGSIRDKARLDSIFAEYRPQIVYHAAAHKHVPLMEDSPREAVKNNVFGTRNLCEVADRYHVETFVQISTDKAVNPTNVMGATKRICEMVVQTFSRHSDTKFVCVRFGNVLGSSGSVIPLFRRQIEQGGPVTVTHKDVIRYFMTIPEAVSLVMQAGAYAKNGEIYVLDMGEPVRIDDLARNMIRLSGYEPDVDIEVRYVGLRPGEKLFEELLLDEEGIRSTANNLIFIGKPLEIDEPAFARQLVQLEEVCHQPDGDVRPLLQEIVPTYQPEKGGVPVHA